MKSISLYPLDAGHGDAVIMSFKRDFDECNILVDGGKSSCVKNVILEKLTELKRLDGIIVTHVDNDHIGGVIKLIKYINNKLALQKAPNFLKGISEFFIVFNKFDESVISYRQGEGLQRELEELKRRIGLIKIKCHLIKSYDIPNDTVINGEIVIKINNYEKREKSHEIDKNSVNITILSPSKISIVEFMNDWLEYRVNKKKGNANIINRTSISFLVEYNETKILMTGDAYIEEILNVIRSLGKDKISKIDLVKMSHHGSYRNNENLDELINEYKCNDVFVSSDGSYGLPDENLIKELINKNQNLRITGTKGMIKGNYKILRKIKLNLGANNYEQ